MKAYRAQGTFRAGKNDQPFTIDLVALDEEDARHRVLSNFGSRHRVPRRFVNIQSLEEIDPTDSNSPVVIAHLRDQ
ncbi:MAG: 50S ribosomal protein L18Ae [Candidatus Thalassarchaeaceae archaeon]|jgi:large subunit ribosomal protein LX|nr:50S ribosomal protein L18a [Euryarchaeota archaeon]MBV13620.1 50S ribosomal protein L18a [Actinomycetota bacterium]MDP6220622.1 50S ribosomal protein L18Ae [Candidatus Thalassarchaeaceae archaeon]MDP7091304.1 50S ribosomal protein L18Ae [Candidatus Thalassarchaeaceae archaeon]MDP7257541.1 50S ribosomal protein L18Ae [Candidatus Thalassarchaeaceae archaeon]